jgi:hypothetical protein
VGQPITKLNYQLVLSVSKIKILISKQIKMFSSTLWYRILLSAILILAPTIEGFPAKADEVWASDYGKVVYQTDRGKTAIWTYGDSAYGTLFISGLVGQLQDRKSYYGYWSQSISKIRCETYREGRDGKRTYYWGSFQIQFLDPSFPSRWSAEFGYCDQPAQLPWRAYPIVGGGLAVPSKLP